MKPLQSLKSHLTEATTAIKTSDPNNAQMEGQKSSHQAKKRKGEIEDDLVSGSSTQTTRTPFVYEPLTLEEDSIRLLQILPGSDESIIRCNMRHATLSDASYTCLSYTWQPSLPEHEIEVNGHPLVVGDNLYQFLHAFRASQGHASPTSLWIDAICINQPDFKEKNHQVRQMGAIYRRSKEVLVWLGVLSKETLRFLQEVNEMTKLSNPYDLNNDPLDTRTANVLNHLEKLREQFMKMSSEQQVYLWDQMCQLCSSPYWHRVWIAQELLLPPHNEIYIFSGYVRYNMVDLACYLIAISGIQHRPAVPRSLGESYCCSRLFRHTGEVKSITSLPTLLFNFGRCGCHNKRDRIFALLSLTENEPCVEIDYEVDYITLFRKVLEKFMPNMPLDKLLYFGAILIQALELRQSFAGAANHLPHNKELGMPGAGHLNIPIRRSPTIAIGSPVWVKATLKIVDCADDRPEREGSASRHTVSCLYIGVFDAEDVHVFEYVVEESETEFSVKYARAYEYLRGEPQIAKQFDETGELRYVWLDRPSEDVHYFSGPFARYGPRRASPSKAWTCAKLEIVEDSSHHVTSQQIGSVDAQHRRLKPAGRSWDQETPWLTHTICVESSIFEAVRNNIEEEVSHNVEHKTIALCGPQSPRATTFALRRSG